MTFRSACSVVLLTVAILAGCSKSEPATTAATPAVPAATPAAPAPAALAAELPAAAAAMQQAVKKMSAVQVPNLIEISPDKLAQVSAEALSQLGAMASSSDVSLDSQLDALKASLTKENALAALSQLKTLTDAARQIPGTDAAIASTQQMVTGWALKQGFDPATINPMLGALQAADLGRLAAHASTLIGTGDLTNQQVELINGVLASYGIDAKASEVINSVKGLLDR